MFKVKYSFMSRIAAAALVTVALSACGGGADESQPTDIAYADPTTYSAAPDASLPSAKEDAAVVHHTHQHGAQSRPYVTTTGHLTARDLVTQSPKASIFYVAYTAKGVDGGQRPITFVYNGGPGSASAFLHIGSFGPKRLAVRPPAAGVVEAFPLVDNPESILDFTDIVFVDAVGTGYSQAIAPNVNKTFWGVDSDAEVFRDFVIRYLDVNKRRDSPKFLFGESYGATRSAVLGLALEKAGVRMAGIVLQSPILDFSVDCGFLGAERASCSGYLPSYAAVATHHTKLSPAPSDVNAFLGVVKTFAESTYDPAIRSLLGQGVVPDAPIVSSVAAKAGVSTSVLQQGFNLDPSTFREKLLPGQLLGRYDARIAVALDSPLAADGDPSLSYIIPSFEASILTVLNDRLRYTAKGKYVMSNPDIGIFDPRHNGRFLPDTVPDLEAAFAINPKLSVLSMSGRYDLATPFYQSERDLKRLGASPSIEIREYDAGHLLALDDRVRVEQFGDLRRFYERAVARSKP